MARTKGSASLSSAIEPKFASALDARMVVKNTAELIDANSFPYSYVGLLTAVQSEGKLYMLTAKPTTTLSNWTEVGSGSGSNNIVEAYYNDSDGLFYEESTFVTPITGEAKVIYIDITTNEIFRFDGTDFVRLDQGTEITVLEVDAIWNSVP